MKFHSLSSAFLALSAILLSSSGIATAQPYNVGFVDHDFDYPLSDEICTAVKAIDCEVTSQRTRNTAMRIYYPTFEAEATEPDDNKDKYMSICQPGSDGTDADRDIYCDKDVIRVMGTEDAVPASQSDGSGFSVVMFSPGDAFMAAIHYTGLVRSLVQRGFVIVALSHPLVDFTVRFDGEFIPRNNKIAGARGNQLLLESNDAIAALNELESLSSFNFDLSGGVGYVGHSLGGAAAMMTSIDDPRRRVSAVVNLDGIMDWRNPLLCLFGGCWAVGTPRNFGAEMTVPWMVVAANGLIGQEVQKQYGWMFKSATRPKPADSLGFFIKKSDHHSFQDQCHAWNNRPFLCGDIDSRDEQFQVDQTVSSYTAAFFELHLQNNASARDVLMTVDENVIGKHIYVHGDGDVEQHFETFDLDDASSATSSITPSSPLLLLLLLGTLGVTIWQNVV